MAPKLGKTNIVQLVDLNFALNDFLKLLTFIDYIFKYIKIEHRLDKQI